MDCGCSASLHMRNVSHHPQQQIKRMQGLVDERPTSIHCQSSAPLRLTVVLRRSIPLHTSVCQQGLANYTVINPLLKPANFRFMAVLEHDTEFYAGLLRCFDEFVGSTGGDIKGLFRQHMQTPARRRYPVC